MQQPKVTPKQLQILIYLYRFRFLNRHHIQQFLNHKDPKRINTWLKQLSEDELIGRIYSKRIGENNKPAVYYLTSKSHSILKDSQITDKRILKRVYRERLRSQRLRDHCLLLADIYFHFLAQVKQRDSFHFFTTTDLVKYTYLPFYRPDAYVSLESSISTKRYFLEIIDPDTPRFALRKKLDYYFEYEDEKTWQTATGYDFPKVLISCPSDSSLYFIKSYLKKKLEEEFVDINFYLILSEKFKSSESIEWIQVTQ